MKHPVQEYFDIKELVCKHVYDRFKEDAWVFLDTAILDTLYAIRKHLDKPIVVNNWAAGGSYSQRGLRCNTCILVKEKTALEKVYLSMHIFGKAIDFSVTGMKSQEVQQWIMQNKHILPHPTRMERNTNGWTHLDVRGDNTQRLTLFNG